MGNAERDRIREVDFWRAVNAYVAACGGDTGQATISGARINAVAQIERMRDDDRAGARFTARQEIAEAARDTEDAREFTKWCMGLDRG